MVNSGLSFAIMCITGLMCLVTLYYLVVVVVEIFKKQRKFKGDGIKGFATLILSMGLIGGIGYCLYYAPDILFLGSTWHMIEVIGPADLITAVISSCALLSVFYVYFVLSHFFPKENDKPFFMIIVLSILSGIGNSIIVFIINEALNRALSNNSDRYINFESRLYLYFLLGIALFTLSAMIVRKRLIAITAAVVYDKRVEIINKILKAPYFKYEALEDSKTYSALNNDPETVSGFVSMLVTGLTGIITMITCFIYLGTLNLYGMIFSILVILLTVGMFMKATKTAEKHFERNRDILELFFKNITDLVNGFKELHINARKREEFKEDMEKNCGLYRDTRMQGEYKYVGVGIFGEIMYFLVIGIAVFTFPIIFSNFEGSTLRNYTVVFLYMGGIVNQQIHIIPNLVRLTVSWKRIKQFISEISMIEDGHGPATDVIEEIAAAKDGQEIAIQFKDVGFHYKNKDGDNFGIGPINYEFKSGEIVFISGGNGSGKSTLAKLLTGLYKPDEGEIRINGQVADMKMLGSSFTTVYSNFYLFEKLYGVNHKDKQNEIQKYLKLLQIEDKVQITDGKFSTLKLSTGQRKRLALLVSYLEDKPVCLFDEWAADQDPEFRRFFYESLLPELRNRGKAVIAITHDDYYFNRADKHIKMDMGKISN
ncbi:MAG: cyclic peptide export ABC transporter [Clostridia bacterium]|nr:cyclic peptide export ABC transporter [Clostridia bacterium]